jgi:hypothetical protein
MIKTQIVKENDKPVAVVLDYKEYLRLKEIEQDRKDFYSASQVKLKSKKWTSRKDLKKANDLDKYVSGRKKKDATLTKGFEEGCETFNKSNSLLSLGGIAAGRKSGAGNERAFVKKVVARKIAKEGR